MLGSKYIVMASAGRASTLDDWKNVADTLTAACEKFRAAGLRAGYHNHQAEFKPLGDKRPMDVIAANTPKDFMLQFDVGTCVEVGQDPVAWIKANPGRINSLHLKDWAAPVRRQREDTACCSAGQAPWAKILTRPKKTGGAEYYRHRARGQPF